MNKIFLNRKFLLIFVAIFFAVIFLQFWGAECEGEEKTIKIEKGWGSTEVADGLKAENLIKNKWLFVFYVWVRGYNNRLQAGEYLLNTKMTIPQISKILAKGETSPNWAKVTIPEGWTSKQIEERLITVGVLRQGDKLPKDQEGFLFPDTYYFYKNSSIETVVKKMRDTFDGKVTEEMKAEIKNQNKNLYDILIMASILEREVVSDEDRSIVSGIFWKRVKNNYPLESCATIAYILGIEKKQYSYEDTRVNSPYNTYINLGLPPTPINNPGLSAIKAAIYPKESDYNFFLSASDGKTIYSKTLEEHNVNKAKYLR
ncbi:MAG: hypothetical protein A2V69_03265 [Candidatus Portnoybacteria bacterium RBG_13_40_8]|uniref:Endolytic murein transglycosylase n=1 Tax=Candidatus Portnoybacteria bacterium RBG_13_40_8 TaxID=1801990 RepID=A0A1G2F5B4_9BACT|nr:MAG: hypothetical protein A2V69_03265 [Candidatus Portnoybacteria bacterium RBG_13_40_8]OGZ34987.1 MAG: hypothetical protein A2V60_00350 [Candidatus Portnoybacteria bacterium RIFCSPHIGHO2_01_FULL_39_19]